MQTTMLLPSKAENLPIAAQTRLAIGIAISCSTLGILADVLLRATPWGLNLPLWVLGFVLAVRLLARSADRAFARHDQLLLWLALAFAGGAAWRDSITLKALDAASAGLLLAFTAWRMQGGSLVLGYLTGYLRGLVQFVTENLLGCLALVLQDIQWNRLPRQRWLNVSMSVGLGLALALPLVILFAGLLSSADLAFRKLVMDVIDINLDKLFLHFFFIGMGAWLACGSLRALLLARRRTLPPTAPPASLRLGPVELGVVLACLNLLFLAFVVVQFRYFFGGATQVEVVAGLTYADYARRGFFELVAVALLVLPLLLGVDWLMRSEPRKGAFRALAGTLVLMLFVIMASAAQRMRLYQHEYGLTELRLYVTAFMNWLAVVFVWFMATVLRGRRERFAFGAVVSGFTVVAALHLLNPDAFIVRANTARAKEGRRLDVNYVASLSADAVPGLLKALPTMAGEQQQQVMRAIARRWPPSEFADWRGLSWGRLQARRAINSQPSHDP